MVSLSFCIPEVKSQMEAREYEVNKVWQKQLSLSLSTEDEDDSGHLGDGDG